METNNPIITPSEFTNFLGNGAIVRRAPNEWFLLSGPFEKRSDDDGREFTLYAPDFFPGPDASYWVPAKVDRLNDLELAKLCENFNSVNVPYPLKWRDADQEGFRVSFEKIKDQIEKASISKAVPIVFETTSERVQTTQLARMIHALLAAPASLFVYGFWQGDRGSIGATPEVLLKQNGGEISTMALAGTRPKEDVHREDLLSDAKELFEHDLVVQDIEDVLSAFGEVFLEGPEILELPTLLHLRTFIRCELRQPREFQFFKACALLHPTPALGVAPRNAGYEWLRGLPEQAGRRGFGAPWGIRWSSDEALCLVAIRNLQWSESGSRIGAGCGIVSKSQFDQEWRELAEKRRSVKRVLGITE